MARILVADDDDLLREFVRVRLAVCGHIIVEAEDGLAALDRLIDGAFDLLLIDDVMPGLTAWEVLAAIAKLPTNQMKSVVISQQDPEAIIDKALELGAAGCLQKPFCSDELSSLVTTLTTISDTKSDDRKSFRSGWMAMLLATAFSPIGSPAHATAAPAPVLSDGSKNQGPVDVEAADTAKWTIGASHERSWISNGAPDWDDTQIGLEFSPHRSSHYSLEVIRSSRFDKTDHLVALRGDWRIAQNASAYLGVATSPEANFREKWGLRAGGGVGLGSGLEVSADSRIARYASGTKFSLTPQLGVSLLDEKVAISGGWINLWESGGQHYQGWSARLRIAPKERLKVFAGVARYPEVETGATRQVQSAFGGLSFKLSDRVDGSMSYARDRYEGAFTRRALSLGLRWTWGRHR